MPETSQQFLLVYVVLFGLAVHAAGCSATPQAGPDAFIEGNIPLGDECKVDVDDEVLPVGLYDVSPGSGFCERDYETHLRISVIVPPHTHPPGTGHGKIEDGILQVHSAEVTLKDPQQRLIDVRASHLPVQNPFQQITAVSLYRLPDGEPSIAVIAIETIPAAYASSLTDFVGQRIIADIQLFSTGYADEQVDFQPFRYWIEICDGCLTQCESTRLEPMPIEQGVAAPTVGVCDDDAGQDGRVCYDAGC